MATAQLGSLLRYVHKLAAGRGSLQRTDRELLDDFSARRDEAAFAALVARHGPMVLRVCRRVLNHEQDAEDAFQATFLILVRKSESIRKCEVLAQWLHGVAYRTAMELKRSAARRRDHEARLWTVMRNAAVSPTWDDVQAVLDEEVQHLPETYRAAFVLCVLEGKKVPQVAGELGVKEGAVWTRLTRARQLLQLRLTRRGIKLAAAVAALTVGSTAQAGLPAVLAKVTIRFGLLVAAGNSAAGVIPTHIAVLAAGVTRAMFLTKAKIATAVLFAVGLVAAGGALTHQALAAKETPPLAQKSEPPAKEEAKPQATRGADDAKDKNGDSIEVSGRVLDPDGKPFGGAKIYFVRDTNPRAVPAPGFSGVRAISDAEGRFRFRLGKRALQPGESEGHLYRGGGWPFSATVTAVGAGYGPGWDARAGKPEVLANQLTLKLVKDDVPIAGRVIDLEGKPIQGVTVRVIGVTPMQKEDLNPWLDALQKRKDGNHIMQWPYRGPTLYPEATGLVKPVVTGADGRFRLAGIGRDRVATLRFAGPTIETRDVYALTRPGQTFSLVRDKNEPQLLGSDVYHPATFEHAVAPTMPVEGTVRDKDTGKPLAGVTVQARIPSAVSGSALDYLRATSDKDGRYRLVGLPKKEGHVLQALPAAGQPYLPSGKTAGAGKGLEPVHLGFELKRGIVIRGHVTDKATGKPIMAQVQYFAFADNPHLRDAPGFLFPGHPPRVSSAKDGSFTLVGLPGRGLLVAKAIYGQETHYIMAAGADQIKGANEQGHFNVAPLIISPHFFNSLAEVNPAKDAESVACDISLDPGKTVTGTVVDPDGKPLEDAHIQGTSSHAQYLRTAQFRITTLNPKRPTVLFFQHDAKNLGAAVLLKGDEPESFTVRLQKCGTLIGRLLDEDGQPRAGLYASIDILGGQLNDGLPGGYGLYQSGMTDKDGRFRIEGVLPGLKVSLRAQKGEDLRALVIIEELTVKAGETKDLGDLKESK